MLVAPIRYDRGVSGKITRAVSFGSPVVTTWVWAEKSASGTARTGGILPRPPPGRLAGVIPAQGGHRMLTLQTLLEQPPLIHNDRRITWGIRPALAHFLDEAVGPGSVTLETGAGLSTLVILRKQPRQHMAVQPVPDEFAAIVEFAERHGIAIHSFTPIVARSQDWLPRADLPELDLVLVDGAHAFPVPFLDWYYAAEKIKVGGLMVVDDTHLVTGTILADFMGVEPRWELVVRDDESHFAIYRKRVHPVHDADWTRQPYLSDAQPTDSTFVVPVVVAPHGDLASADDQGRASGPRLACVEVRGWDEYRRYRAAMAGELRRREAVELSVIDFAGERFHVDGFCAVCQRPGRFDVSFTYSYRKTGDGRPIPNWREHLICACGFNNRMRAAVQIVQQEICPGSNARIYLTERATGLYQWLQARYPNLVGMEYLGDRVRRRIEHDGIRNEDLTALTFADESFDLILSFDVMQHVADSDAALRECLRCLRPGGIFLFGAPFRLDSRQNVEREHLMAPEHHRQPLTAEIGALCFRDFGWQVLDQLRAAGFADPRVVLYWSLELGYLGGDQVLVVASRPGQGREDR